MPYVTVTPPSVIVAPPPAKVINERGNEVINHPRFGIIECLPHWADMDPISPML